MCSHTAKELNLKFNQLYRRQCSLYHTYAAAYHLSDAAFSILYCLCEAEHEEPTHPFTQHGLAELCSLPRQTVNSAISGLVKNGYVKLTQLAGAGNTKAVRLTEKGKQLCRKVIDPLIMAEQNSLAQMTPNKVHLCLELSVRQLDLLEEELALILPKKEHPVGE